MQFKQFILNENQVYLGHRIGDILTAAQDLQDDFDNLGSRQTSRMIDQIVGQIRKILHSEWKSEQRPYLKQLQAVAVMLKKSVDEKKIQGQTYNLKDVLNMATQKLEEISGKLGVAVNDLNGPSEDKQDISQQNFQLTGQDQPLGPQPEQQPQP